MCQIRLVEMTSDRAHANCGFSYSLRVQAKYCLPPLVIPGGTAESRGVMRLCRLRAWKSIIGCFTDKTLATQGLLISEHVDQYACCSILWLLVDRGFLLHYTGVYSTGDYLIWYIYHGESRAWGGPKGRPITASQHSCLQWTSRELYYQLSSMAAQRMSQTDPIVLCNMYRARIAACQGL